MYRISELAKNVGLSRTTLLHYEKLGLIQGQRLSNGYRVYTDYDLQRLQLLQKLHAGGLTLKECKACLEAKVERRVLSERLQELDKEILQKQQARTLLAALLGERSLKEWHESVEKVAPDAHLDWLIQQGFTEKEALRLKWLSKDMNEHDQYIEEFLWIFEGLDRWGPGSEQDTLRALKQLPLPPLNLLEIGCGKGVATVVLAEHTSAQITAVDNEALALSRLRERATEAGVESRIKTVCASMTNLPFEARSFDVLWSESSAYVMGFSNALRDWKDLLKTNGVLVVSDLVWTTLPPRKETRIFWEKEYPDMTNAETRLEQAITEGYTVLDSFSMSDEAWKGYFEPLQARVNALQHEFGESAAMHDIQHELDICMNPSGEFGYHMFVLQIKN